MIPSAQRVEGSATSVEVQKKVKCRGGKMCGDLPRGRGVAAVVPLGGLMHYGVNLVFILQAAGKVGSGFQFAGFLLTPPPGAVLDLSGLQRDKRHRGQRSMA